MKSLPYHQTFDGNYWYHIFFEIFLKDILMSQRIFVVQLSQKPLKNFQKGLQERTPSEAASPPEAIGIWVAHKPAWPEKWMVFVQRDDGHKYGVVKFRIRNEPWIFFGLWLRVFMGEFSSPFVGQLRLEETLHERNCSVSSFCPKINQHRSLLWVLVLIFSSLTTSISEPISHKVTGPFKSRNKPLVYCILLLLNKNPQNASF